MFCTAEAELSAEIPVAEIYVRDKYKYGFWSNKDVSEGYMRDITFKESFSMGCSIYFLVGFEVEVSYDFKSVFDYILIM